MSFLWSDFARNVSAAAPYAQATAARMAYAQTPSQMRSLARHDAFAAGVTLASAVVPPGLPQHHLLTAADRRTGDTLDLLA